MSVTSASTKAAEAARRWRAENPERAREINRRWRKHNPDAHKASQKRHYEKNKAKIKARSAAWRKNNITVARERARERHLRRMYGMSMAAFSALLRGQENRCAICRALDGDWVVDHDHTSGAVRGVLCRQCNIALGGFKDSVAALTQAIKYLVLR